MAGKSDYLESKVLDHILGLTTYTPPANVYVALFTAAPTDAGTGGSEVTGGSYARATVVNNTTNFPNAVAGVKSNGVAIDFPAATAPWGTVVAVGIYDALVSGNLLYWTTLPASRTVNIGDIVGFAINQLQFTED